KHLDHYHKNEYLKLAKEKGWTTTLPSVKLKVSIAPIKPRITFSPEQVLQKLVRFIAANDQSLNIVENVEFCNLLTLFCDNYMDEDMPHQSKICVAILNMWRGWFSQLKWELMNAVGALHFTTDMWSDRRHSSYICITVHWIAYKHPAERAGLVFKLSLLAFHALPGWHTGPRIAQAVYQLLDRAGVNGGNVSIDFQHVML
ncbi:hypothetical protein L208DRAFT_1299443, partial [Tricholoma matsutake]